MDLRQYQEDAVNAIIDKFSSFDSTLLEMATGTGKTQVACEVVKRIGGRCLWLAHRYELIEQARARLEECLHEEIGVEQADRASGDRITVASVQSLNQHRLDRLGPLDYACVIADEAHHAPSRSWRKIITRFSKSKRLLMTATPQRLDRIGLRAVCDSVAFRYGLSDAIRDKWLVPIVAKRVRVTSIDLTGVKRTAGDLNSAQLDAIVASQESLHGIAKACISECSDRSTLVFATSVETAERISDVINLYMPGRARSASGETPFYVRSELIEQHKRRAFQFFVTVGIFTEGVDLPWVSCIVLARPTCSVALYTQMIGRGTRLYHGKINLLVIDLVGNSAKHKLASPADALSGNVSPIVADRVKEILESEGERDILELVELAEREEQERLRAEEAAQSEILQSHLDAIRASVKYDATLVDLFSHYGIDKKAHLELVSMNRPTAGQLLMMRKLGLPIPPDLTTNAARVLIGKESARRRFGWATYRQVIKLGQHGIDGRSMRKWEASKAIEELRDRVNRVDA